MPRSSRSVGAQHHGAGAIGEDDRHVSALGRHSPSPWTGPPLPPPVCGGTGRCGSRRRPPRARTRTRCTGYGCRAPGSVPIPRLAGGTRRCRGRSGRAWRWRTRSRPAPPAATSAISSACRVAASARSTPVSPSRTQRRSWIPVRVRIHSSLVSMIRERSSLVTTRSGTAKPVPRKRVRGIPPMYPAYGIRVRAGPSSARPPRATRSRPARPPSSPTPCRARSPTPARWA